MTRVGLAWLAWLGAGVAGVVTAQPQSSGAASAGTSEGSLPGGPDGAVYRLAQGLSVWLPPGLNVDSAARTPSLRMAAQRVPAREIGPGFVPIGPSVVFDAALHSPGAPVTVRYEARRFAVRGGHRAVLAVEYAKECTVPAAGRALGGGRCAQFRLADATYDAAVGHLSAAVPEVGGMRMQFGSVPATLPDSD